MHQTLDGCLVAARINGPHPTDDRVADVERTKRHRPRESRPNTLADHPQNQQAERDRLGHLGATATQEPG